MKMLMLWARGPLMEEAGTDGGGATTQTATTTDTPTNTATPTQPDTPTNTATTTQTNPPTTTQTDAPTQPEPKPFLGDDPNKAQPKQEDKKPAEPTEDDYLNAVVKDETLLGKDDSVTLDQDLVKAMIPAAKELGVSPETMGKLANALAKAQIDRGREALQARTDYFNRMKEESVKKYTPADFAQINQGIDHWFKPGGTMNGVIRSSELGADPEFLALMHYLGSKRVMDSLSGATDAGGTEAGDPNGIGGISKLW